MKSSKEGTRCIQVEITPTSSRISRNAVTSMSIRGHRWKRHGKHSSGPSSAGSFPWRSAAVVVDPVTLGKHRRSLVNKAPRFSSRDTDNERVTRLVLGI